MFVVLGFFFVLVFILLHTFFELLFFGGVAEDIHEVEDDHVFVISLFERIGDPFVGFAADIDKDIAVGDIHDVLGCGLVAVKIDAVVEKQIEVDVDIVSRDLAYPVVEGEDGGDDLDLPLIGGLGGSGTAGKG